MLRSIVLAALLLAPTSTPPPGAVYRINIVRESSEKSDAGMTGETYDRDEIVERVIAVRDDGIELEYDIAKPTAQDRDVAWQYPIRVFKPVGGPLRLTNATEMQARADAWRKRAKLPPEACGHWYFTWNAFRVECDPQAVLPSITALDIQLPDLRDGAPYRSPQARAPAPLARAANGSFTVTLVLDPEVVRRGEVESDLILAEILKKPLTRDAAIRARATEDISGTIMVTFDVDKTGQVTRRTTVTNTAIKGADGKITTRTATETIERLPAN